MKRKKILLFMIVFTASLAVSLGIGASKKAMAATPPSTAAQRYYNSCPGGPGPGQTVHGVYPNPTNITSGSTSGTTNLYATSYICSFASYSSVTNIRIHVTDIQTINGSANACFPFGLSCPQTHDFGPYNVSCKGCFSDGANPSYPMQMTNLREGWNTFRIHFYASASNGVSGNGWWDVAVFFDRIYPDTPPTISVSNPRCDNQDDFTITSNDANSGSYSVRWRRESSDNRGATWPNIGNWNTVSGFPGSRTIAMPATVDTRMYRIRVETRGVDPEAGRTPPYVSDVSNRWGPCRPPIISARIDCANQRFIVTSSDPDYDGSNNADYSVQYTIRNSTGTVTHDSGDMAPPWPGSHTRSMASYNQNNQYRIYASTMGIDGQGNASGPRISLDDDASNRWPNNYIVYYCPPGGGSGTVDCGSLTTLPAGNPDASTSFAVRLAVTHSIIPSSFNFTVTSVVGPATLSLTKAGQSSTSATYITAGAPAGTYTITWNYTSNLTPSVLTCDGQVTIDSNPNVVSCDDLVTNLSDNPEVNQGFRVTVSVNIGTVPTSPNFTLSSSPAGLTFNRLSQNNNSAVFETTGGPLGTYTLTWTYTSSNLVPNTLTCDRPITITAKPYLQVFGGDTIAGGGFPGACTDNGAQINTWYNPTDSAGSGVQFAAMALGEITGFPSAILRTAPPELNTGLSFANDTGNIDLANQKYGGNFEEATCIYDYWDLVRPATASVTPGVPITLPNTGSVHFDNNQAVRIEVSSYNGRGSVFADGDVYITGDVRFNPGTWGTGNVPMLFVIARGNIFVDPSVQQMDGVYVSYGTIFTCAPSGNFVDPVVNPNTYLGGGVCRDRQLVINGSFVANKVNFLRTRSSLRNANQGDTAAASAAAEVFNFSPELYLGNTCVALPAACTSSAEYDSITSLPPIL